VLALFALTSGQKKARAGVLVGLISLVAAGCTVIDAPPAIDLPAEPLMYASVVDDGFRVPAVPLSKVAPEFRRKVVPTPGTFAYDPGTVVVDPEGRYLYLVLEGGQSIRYGIGVGREGFAWSGEATIKDKQHWPKWFPPKEMVERDPKARPYAKGMDGGPRNPLGARALYLWQGGKDTLYRLHGTNDPSSIGKAVSSGCVRMLDQDVMDLYERVPLNSKVVVLSATQDFPVANIFDQLFPPEPVEQPPAPAPSKKPVKTGKGAPKKT
jgi:lipoprotein-anchoring transpeptidase ErfK/SrfK